MADSFSPYLKIRLPQTGAYNNTWGAVLNADAFTLLDDAITGRTQIALSGLTYSLGALTDGSDADARSFCLYFTGAPSGTVTVTLPVSVTKKFYLIDNQCGQDITFTYSGSTDTVTIATATRKLIWCDGTNCWPVFASAADSTALGGVDAQYWARTGRTAGEIAAVTYLSNVYVNKVRNSAPWATVTEGVTTTIDCRDGNHQKLTLTGNRTMAAPTNPVDGQVLLLLIVQDGAGSRTLTWNAAFQFVNGFAPTLTSIGGNKDLFLMVYDSVTSTWNVSHLSYNIGAGGSAAYNLTFEHNETDVNVFARLGSPGVAATINLTINTGVIISASSPATAALDLSSFASGSTINLFNSGYVIGKGGDGGDGGEYAADSFQQDQSTSWAKDGEPGGNAILGPGVGRTFNVTNANGFIWGGGGGGGGGGTDSSLAGNVNAAGGGGGGGAGSGAPGRGGHTGHGGTTVARAVYGLPGSTGPNGAGGAGGAGSSVGVTGGAGGDGGDFGAAGANGVAGGSPGQGGIAGKAIELAGGAMGTFTGSGAPHTLGAVS